MRLEIAILDIRNIYFAAKNDFTTPPNYFVLVITFIVTYPSTQIFVFNINVQKHNYLADTLYSFARALIQ